MKQGIIICSWSGGKQWLDQCLKSLDGCVFPITVIINDGGNTDPTWIKSIKHDVLLLPEDSYEVGAIKAGKDIYDEFFFLQDTCEFLDYSILDIIFYQYKGRTVQWGHRFQSYLGKFRKETLDHLEFPIIKSKADSVFQENNFIAEYRSRDTDIIELFPDFSDLLGHEEEHFGRNNLKIENKYLIKWKGYWV